VVGGGIEATSGGEEFAGLLHANEHFAPGVVVVGGSVEDGGYVLGRGAGVQEVENGLTMGGVQGGRAEACQVGASAFTSAVECRDVLCGNVAVVGEDGRLWTEEMTGGEQEGVIFVFGIGCEEEAAAGGVEQGRWWARCFQGVGNGCVEGADEEDGTVGLLGEVHEGWQGTREAWDGTGRIENDEASVEVTDGGGQLRKVVGKGEGVGGVVGRRSRLGRKLRRTEEQNMGGIASGGFQARFEGGGGRVIGGEEDDVARLGRSAGVLRNTGKRRATGDAGGQGEGEEGGVTARGGVK